MYQRTTVQAKSSQPSGGEEDHDMADEVPGHQSSSRQEIGSRHQRWLPTAWNIQKPFFCGQSVIRFEAETFGGAGRGDAMRQRCARLGERDLLFPSLRAAL